MEADMYKYGIPFREAKTKTEDGKNYSASAYLYVPDPDLPSTWKLRIEDEPGKVTAQQLGRAAAALGPGFRGRKVEIPAEARKAVIKKLAGLYRKLDKEPPPYLTGGG